MAKGKAIDWSEKDIEKLSEVSPLDISKAQAWATPELQDLLTATDEIPDANPTR